ncbi:MAG TPA: ABC transporter permease subunit [Candidatus Binatia bacterium]|nr:ABC transporter permease subunit [Candidatus Binatia bacterium]
MIVQLAFETLAIAGCAFAIALTLGLPAAVIVVRGGIVGKIVAFLATAVRAIPDLVLAIICVAALGLGPVAGVTALGINTGAVLAKLFAELLLAVRREPEEALRAIGASPLTSFLIGLVPEAWPGLVGFAAYALESIIRGSVIVGIVGAGGLGSAIVQSFNLANYHEFFMYIAWLVVIVILVDALSGWLRERAPAFAAVGVFCAIAAAGVAGIALSGNVSGSDLARALPRVVHFLADEMPPDFSAKVIATATDGIEVTIVVAIVGTFGGALLAVPLALLAAPRIALGWMRGTGYAPWSYVPMIISRFGLAIVRAIPPLALGLLALSIVGLGPKAGAVALALHTAGVLGKLFGESLEIAPLTEAESLVATGAPATAAALVGLVPGALNALLSHLAYRWEWNVRASTTLGMIGAGGIGQAIFNAQQLLFYHQLIAYVIFAVALVVAGDVVSQAFRARLHLRTVLR